MEMKVVNLETAKALKEAGWAVANDWSWVEMTAPVNKVQRSHTYDAVKWSVENGWQYYPAPDVSELLDAIDVEELRLYALKKPFGGKEYLAYPLGGLEKITGRGENPAEALAALWLELRKRKLV